MPGAGAAGDVGVAGERVADVDRVRAVRVQRPPGLVGDPHLRDDGTGLGDEVTDVREEPLPHGVPLPPGTAGGREALVGERTVLRQGQACFAARKPESRSARMSSMFSMPTARRTRPGVTPAASLLLGGQLRVRRRRRVDHQAAHVADVGDVAVQLERLDERLAGLDAALDLEAQHGAGALAARTSGRARTTGSTAGPRSSRTRPRRDPRATPRRPCAFSTCRSMRRDSVSRPWAMRNALNGETAAPRSRSSWTRALRMNDRFAPNAEPDAEVARVDEAVVARVRLVVVREALRVLRVVEGAAVDDHAGDRRAMPAEVLGRRVDDDVGAPLERADQVRASRRCCR